MRTKDEMLYELKVMLRDVFVLRSGGSSYARLARAHGYVDGYMRALLESGHASKEELLEIVAAERAAVSGPATRALVRDDEETVAA